MTRKPKPDARPKDAPEDEPGPQLLTQRRAANQVEQMHLDLARIVGRLEGLTHYVGAAGSVADCLNVLTAELKALRVIRARLLTGEIPIVRGEDAGSYAQRQPLIAAIEARTNGAAPHVDAGPDAERRCGQCGKVYPADRRRKKCPRCGAAIGQHDATEGSSCQ